MVFRSKQDAWITISLLAASIAMLFTAGATMLRGGPVEQLVLPPFALLMAAFCVYILAGTRYVLNGDELRIWCGPLRWRVGVQSITAVKITDDPTSAPALSLDRIRIDYVKKNGKPDMVLVSPADKDGFIAALRARNPAISLLP